jgi:hypothetical protein
VISWCFAGLSLVALPTLISGFLLRSSYQQRVHLLDYLEFKKTLKKMLENEDLKQTIRAVFIEGEGPTPSSGKLKMRLPDFDKKTGLRHDFNLKSLESDEGFKKFVKDKMDQLGLIENPFETKPQLKEIIEKRVKRKPKAKTVYFRDFIKDYVGPDIIDAEILEESIRFRQNNEL